MESKKTPIYESHVALGGRIVEFAGYLMPVSFDGIIAEHGKVRTQVGLFDVSHMGEIEITGPDARAFTDYFVSNNVGKLAPGQICYTVACNEKGKVLDDLLVYKFSDERIMLVVNAVNTNKILEHVRHVKRGDIEIRNRTGQIGQIAVQGPNSLELLGAIDLCAPVRDRIGELRYYRFLTIDYGGSEVILSRTGYTGERGYEIYLPAGDAPGVWKELLEAGRDLGVAPIGLGARDTLRFEAGYCLYGHELDEATSPLEAGLSWVVKFKKDDYIGRSVLAAEKESGPSRRLIGLELKGRGIARQGYTVLEDGAGIGRVTSGTFAPTLGKSLAMALVSSAASPEEGDLAVEIRGKKVPAGVVPLPFYASRSSD